MTWENCAESTAWCERATCKWCGCVLQPRDGIAAPECWRCRTEGPPAEVLGPDYAPSLVYEKGR